MSLNQENSYQTVKENSQKLISLYSLEGKRLPEWVDHFLDISVLASGVFKDDYQLLCVNDALRKLVGIPLTTSAPLYFTDLVSSLDLNELHDQCRKLNAGTLHKSSSEVLIKVGQHDFQRCSCTLKYLPEESIFLFSLDKASHEIIELKQQILQDETNLRLAMDSVESALAIINFNYEIIEANGKFVEALSNRFGMGLVRGQTNLYMFEEDIIVQWKLMIDDAFEGLNVNKKWQYGSSVLSVMIRPMIWCEQIMGASISITDITLSVNHQEQLNKLAIVLKETDNFILLIDKKGNITWSNNSFHKFYGTRALESDFHINDLWIKKEAKKIEKVEEAIQHRKPFQTWMKIRNSRNNISWVDMDLKPIFDKKGDFLETAIIMRDITFRMIQQQAITNRNQELVKANQELDNFVYKVSHDLRAPVASALGLTNIMKNEKDVNNLNYYSDLIGKSMLKLDDFIRSILDHSRNVRLNVQVEKIDIGLLLQQVRSDLSFSFSNHLKISIRHGESCAFYNDKFRLRLIINNLLTNAYRFADNQKDINLLTIVWKVDEEHLQLEFRDNGIGIKAEHQDKIWEMFYRATDTQHGSGLGLYIVNDAIKKLNGIVDLESHYKVGTTFKVKIPNHTKKVEAELAD